MPGLIILSYRHYVSFLSWYRT